MNQEYQKYIFVLSVKRFKHDISKHTTKYTRMHMYMYAKKHTINLQKKILLKLSEDVTPYTRD